jgi:DEAD/DEAH box helicase domain-containing protein
MGSLHALEHASIALFPLFALCDRWDLGGVSTPFHPDAGMAAVFIYDGVPGGVGLARLAYDVYPELIRKVAEHLEACTCEIGCPSCIHSPKCGSRNQPLDKGGALALARLFARHLRPAVNDHVHPQPDAAGAIALARLFAPASDRGVQDSSRVSRFASEQKGPESLNFARRATRDGSAGSEADAQRETDLPAVSQDAQRETNPPSLNQTQDAERETRNLSVPLSRDAQRETRNLPKHGHTLVFDLETQKLAEEVGGWGNKRAMRLSVGVVYDMEDGVFREYMEDAAKDLAADLAAARLVIGFNIKNFDYEVLAAYVPRDQLDAMPTLDLLERVAAVLKRRVRLDDLAKATLGAGKSADGVEAVKWFRARDWGKLIEYCRHDVAVTRDLYLFGRDNKHVLFPSIQGVMKLPVEW